MYKTLGCFHTLQPTSSPFETPSIPALLPTGFVEWQRLQLLLCPGEHVPFMQEAVRRYDIPTADGGIFPKYIPREAFPARPDEGMEKWHRMVTGSLEQAQYTRRLKNSPYASPRDAPHRGEGYFSANGKLLQVRRPSRSPRSNSHDLDPARLADERRRSSVPDIPSPFPPNQENTYRSGDAQQFPPPNSRTKQAQYNAPNRASNASSQHRTSDASSSRHRYSNSSHRTSNSSATYRPPLGSSVEASKQVPQSTPHTRHHRRPRSPSTINESSSGSEASSENSQAGRGRNSHEARDGRRRSSLFPPEIIRHHLRRHSHDATYLPNGKPPLPPRPIGNSPHMQDPLLSARPGSGYKNGHNSGPVPAKVNSVQFRDNVFDPRSDDAVTSAPESPVPVENLSPSINPKLHSFDPAGHRELVRQYDEADMNQGRANERKSGMPLRISTVTGVGGRKYAATDARSAFAGGSLSPPKQLGIVSMGDGR
jgi:hypothetical protein